MFTTWWPSPCLLATEAFPDAPYVIMILICFPLTIFTRGTSAFSIIPQLSQYFVNSVPALSEHFTSKNSKERLYMGKKTNPKQKCSSVWTWNILSVCSIRLPWFANPYLCLTQLGFVFIRAFCYYFFAVHCGEWRTHTTPRSCQRCSAATHCWGKVTFSTLATSSKKEILS